MEKTVFTGLAFNIGNLKANIEHKEELGKTDAELIEEFEDKIVNLLLHYANNFDRHRFLEIVEETRLKITDDISKTMAGVKRGNYKGGVR